MSFSLIDRLQISIYKRQLFPLKKEIGLKNYAVFMATKKTFNSDFTMPRV
jgi:hypothetical protein